MTERDAIKQVVEQSITTKVDIFSVRLSCCFIVHDNPPKLQINEDAGEIFMEITL